ncbi:MAG: hypothetical protein Q8N63_00930 [Nanoarchaeota archaeon]|nr:hypothetical protein [Nanoarchaeota archaeon]
MKAIRIYLLITVIMALTINVPLVSAHCPLCAAAAGAGIGIARWAGVDDSIVGLFLGAFIVSLGLWFNNMLKKRKVNIPIQKILLIFASFLLTIIPLYLAGIIKNFAIVKSLPELSMLGFEVFGIDKLLFGTIIGVIFVGFSFSLSDYIKKLNGKVLFHYQGILFMIFTLLILTEVFWLITK